MSERSVNWWTNWLKHEISRVHNCDSNPHDDVGVLFHEGLDNELRWYLTITWAATEEDVAKGEVPELGEILSATEVPIFFCPFCGKKLVIERDA